MDPKEKQNRFTPNISDYHAVRQHEGVYTRETENSFWRILPILSFGTILGIFIYTVVRFTKLMGHPFQTKFGLSYLIVIAGILISILLFPIYIVIVYILRKIIKPLYIGTPIVSSALIIGIGIYTKNTGFIFSGSFTLLISLLYFWCLWLDIKIAVITIKTASSHFNKIKGRIFIQFLWLLTITSIVIGLCMLIVINSLAMIGAELITKSSKIKSDEQNVIWIFMSISTFLSVYMLEFLAAVSFIYGAAFFNQFSIAKAEYGQREYIVTTKEAKFIAFHSSLGIACLGALIITIVSLVVNSAKKNANNEKGNVGSLLLYCINSIIGEILEFLTAQAYVYSAFYAKGLFASGKMGLQSFKTAGIEKYINFKLTSSMLNMLTSFLSVICSMIIGFIVYRYSMEINIQDNQSSTLTLYMAAMLGVYIVIILAVPFYSINSMIGGSAAAQIAVYVEDPDRFKKSHKKAEKLEKYLRC